MLKLFAFIFHTFPSFDPDMKTGVMDADGGTGERNV